MSPLPRFLCFCFPGFSFNMPFLSFSFCLSALFIFTILNTYITFPFLHVIVCLSFWLPTLNFPLQMPFWQWRSHWGCKGAWCHPWQRKKMPKIGKKKEKSRKKEEKSGRKGKNREGFFTLLLLADRAGYATAFCPSFYMTFCRKHIVFHNQGLLSYRPTLISEFAKITFTWT